MRLFWEISVIVIKGLRHFGFSEISWHPSLNLKILVLLSPELALISTVWPQHSPNSTNEHVPVLNTITVEKSGNVMSCPRVTSAALRWSTTANSSPCIVRLPVAGNGNELKHELDTRQLEKNLCWLPVELCWTILNQELHHLHNLLMSIGAGLQGRDTIRSQGLQTWTSNPHCWDLTENCIYKIRLLLSCRLSIRFLVNSPVKKEYSNCHYNTQ